MPLKNYVITKRQYLVAVLLLCTAALPGCDAFGTGDNAPTVFDSAEEKAARDQRRSESPGTAIYGKPYVFIDAMINGETLAPDSTPPPRIVLEDRLVKGWDGCHAISAMAGIFSPSGYEFSLLDSGPLQDAEKAERYPCSEPNEQPWMALYELENRVWSLSIDDDGVLQMKDYNGEPYAFRLRPAPE